MFLYRHSKVKGGEKGKHISLNECNQQFKQTHKYRKGYRKTYTYSKSQECVDIPENKDQTDKPKDDRMTCRNVGKETNHQHKRLCKYSNDLNDGHEWYREF